MISPVPNSERAEFVYRQLNGFEHEHTAGNVKNEFSPGGALYPLIQQIFTVRDRLCQRYGIDSDHDRDLDEFFSLWEEFCRESGVWMYKYGWQDRDQFFFEKP